MQTNKTKYKKQQKKSKNIYRHSHSSFALFKGKTKAILFPCHFLFEKNILFYITNFLNFENLFLAYLLFYFTVIAAKYKINFVF